MQRFLALLIVLVCALPLGVAAQEPIPAETAPAAPAIDIEELKAKIQEILDEDGIPGASVALVNTEGTIWAGGVGKADVAAGIDVTADHLFRVGSISKSFTALAVLTAVEDGLIDLTAPVRNLAPEIEFSNPWQDTHPVTVAMVMEHTTGFDDIRVREYAKVDDPGITLAEGLAYNPSSRTSRWKPGTHMSYCNSGPPIAAYVLEKATGRVFEDYAHEQVFNVLGMPTSTFHFPEDEALMAKGYDGDGETEAHYDHITVRPSGGLNSSSREMARYLRMMINRGTLDGVELLSPETITRMETPTTTLAARAGHDFGYGLGNYSSLVKGHRFQGHNGGITGFVSTSAYSSDLGVGFFVSINKPSGKLRDIAKLLGERLTTGVEAPEAPGTVLDADELEAIAGFYQSVTPRQQLTYVVERFSSIQRITVESGDLFTKGLFGGEKKKLIPVSASSFRLEDQPEATIFNVVDEAGDLIAQGNLGAANRKVSGFWVLIQLSTVIATLLLMVSALLFALVWAPLKIFRRLKTIPLRVVLVPLLATLSSGVALILPFFMSSDMVGDFGHMTSVSLTLYLGSLMFTALTALSLYTSYRSFSLEMGRGVRLHAILVSAACTVAWAYLWANDLIGLRTWVY